MCMWIIISFKNVSVESEGEQSATGIEELEFVNQKATNSRFDVYTLSGVKVGHQASSLKGLPKGIYLVNGKKVAVK